MQPNLKYINEHQQCGFQCRKALNPKGVIVFNPAVAGVQLQFVASCGESELVSLVAGQTREAISLWLGALTTNQAPKCFHYLLLLIKGPFSS